MINYVVDICHHFYKTIDYKHFCHNFLNWKKINHFNSIKHTHKQRTDIDPVDKFGILIQMNTIIINDQ